MAKRDTELFGNSDIFGTGPAPDTGLFAQPKVSQPQPSRLASNVLRQSLKAPSKKELAAQQAAQQEAWLTGLGQSLQQSPEWQNATHWGKQEILDKWLKDKWPIVQQRLGIDPTDPKSIGDSFTLQQQIVNPLRQDITTSEKAYNDTNRAVDTYYGAVANAQQIGSAVTDLAPAAITQARIDNLNSILAKPGQPLVLGGVPQMDSQGQPVIQPAYTAEQAADIRSQIADLEKTRDAQLKEAQQASKGVEATRAQQSEGQRERERRVQELAARGEENPQLAALGDAPVAGTLQLIGENLPQVLATVPAAAAGQVVGIPAAATAVGLNALLTAADAGGGASQQIEQMPQAELDKSPEYQALIQNGETPARARELLQLRAFTPAFLQGAAIGTAVGPISEVVPIARMAGNIVARTGLGAAAQTTVGSVGGAVARGALRGVSEFPEEYLTQVASNYGQQEATGVQGDLTKGALEAGVLGVLAGAPLGAVGGAGEAATARRAAAVEREQARPAVAETPVAPAAQPSDLGGIVNAAPQETATAGTTTGPAAPSAQAQANRQNAAARKNLSTVTQAVAGAADASTPLSQTERSTIFEAAYQAEQAGLAPRALQTAFTTLDTRRKSENSPLAEQYEAFKVERAQRPATEVMTDGTTSPTAPIPGVDYSSSAISAHIDSQMGETTSVNTEPATAVPGDVESANRLPETTEPGRAERNGATANEGDTGAAGRVGTDTTELGADGRPDNPVDAGTGTQPDTGAGVAQRAAGTSAVDNSGTASTGTTQAGGLTEASPFTIPTQPESLQEATNAVQEQSPTGEVLRDGQQEVGLPEVGEGNQGETTGEGQAQAQEVTAPTSTPAGRSLNRMDGMTESLLDGEYASEGLAMSQALEAGNYAKVDEISDYLASQGLRRFQAPEVAQGAARRTLGQHVAALSEADQTTLAESYADAFADNPTHPDVDSPAAFHSAMVRSAMDVQAGAEPSSGLYFRLKSAARTVVDKLAKAMAAIVLAVTLNHMIPINDAVAAQGIAQVTQSVQRAGLSNSANVVNSWVMQSKDNKGQRYLIADKATGEIHVMSAKGEVLATAPALYGRKTGDGMSLGETPAGTFMLKQTAAPASYGGDLQQFGTAPNGDIYAVHRVLTNNPKQDRLGRLASKSAADNRISLGCINIPADVYNKYLSHGFQGKLYVLPDAHKLSETFPGLNESDAKLNLQQGQQLPADLSRADNDQFVDSTAQLAPTNQDAANTMETQTIQQTEDSVQAEPDNTPANNLLWSAILFPVLARKRRNGTRMAAEPGTQRDGADAGVDIPDDVPPSTRNEQDYSFGGLVGTENESLPGNSNQKRDEIMSNAHVRLRTATLDTQTPFLKWAVDRAGLTQAGREYDDIRAWQLLKAIPGVKTHWMAEIERTLIKPIERHAVSVADRLGWSNEKAAKFLHSWVTFQHIPEANAALRAKLEQDTIDAWDSPIDQLDKRVADAEDALQAFDDAQAGGERAPMAGGLTDAEAARNAEFIEQSGITREELETAQRLTRHAITQLNELRVEQGTLSRETLDAWNAKGFQNYVPLYVAQEEVKANNSVFDQDNDTFLGTSTLNPAGDYTRSGSMRPANNSLETLVEYANRTAAGIASAPFRNELNRLYETMKAQGNTAGLNRVNVRQQFRSKEERDAPGLYVEVPQKDGPAARYKLYFDDANIINAIKKTVPPVGAVGQVLLSAHRTLGAIWTKFNPMFPITNLARDMQERIINGANRKIFDAQGQQVPPRKLVAGALSHSANPKMAKQIIQYRRGNVRGVYGQYLDELSRLGGVSSLNDVLARDSKGVVEQLKKQRGWRKVVAGAGKWATEYNEFFNTTAVLGLYTAMRENGVPALEASARTLDLMNFRQSGALAQKLSFFSPFVNPSFQGAGNLVRTLGTRGGQLTYLGLTLAGIAAYSALQGLAGDDEDGNDRMDKIGMSQLGRGIPLITRDGSVYSLPVGYGMAQVAWTTAASLHRMSRGKMDGKDAALEIGSAFAKNTVPGDRPEFSPFEHPMEYLLQALTPSILTPVAQAATNMDAFGNYIHSQAQAGRRASESGRTRTPEFWQDLAQGIANATNGAVDIYPESIRQLAKGYLSGPLRGLTAWAEADDKYKSGGRLTAQQELGPIGTALGLSAVYSNENMATQRMYYDRAAKSDAILRKFNVPKSDVANQGKKGTKIPTIAGKLAQAGATQDQIALVVASVQSEEELKKVNTNIRKLYLQAKAVGWEPEQLKPAFDGVAQAQDGIMRNYLNQTRNLKP